MHFPSTFSSLITTKFLEKVTDIVFFSFYPLIMELIQSGLYIITLPQLSSLSLDKLVIKISCKQTCLE